ncbi:MAG: T9SS type A sorting domain-containing protein, partial [candidate division Zixibacteria bacterium]|nr:T9SS type A sorting domain-containing protein [candidate division Zixibacteria bacterium]
DGRVDRGAIGIENSAGDIGIEVCRNELYTYGEKTVQFDVGVAPGEFDWLSFDDDDGSLNPGYTADVLITCSANNHQQGVYMGVIDVYSNDPDEIHYEVPVNMTVGITSVDEDQPLPIRFALEQNYPNPFNPSTEIIYSLPTPSDVRLEVFNLMGQQITTLVDSHQKAGNYSVNWDASDKASGLYFYRLTAGENVFTKRMTLLK